MEPKLSTELPIVSDVNFFGVLALKMFWFQHEERYRTHVILES